MQLSSHSGKYRGRHLLTGPATQFGNVSRSILPSHLQVGLQSKVLLLLMISDSYGWQQKCCQFDVLANGFHSRKVALGQESMQISIC
jgi:hypothetical protein